MEITLGKACCRGMLILRYFSIFLQQTYQIRRFKRQRLSRFFSSFWSFSTPFWGEHLKNLDNAQIYMESIKNTAQKMKFFI